MNTHIQRQRRMRQKTLIPTRKPTVRSLEHTARKLIHQRPRYRNLARRRHFQNDAVERDAEGVALRGQGEGGVHYFLIEYDEACGGEREGYEGEEGGEVGLPPVVEVCQSISASSVDKVRIN